MTFLRDTNLISELIRRQPHPRVVAWLRDQSSIALSAETVEEVHFGLTWKPHPRIQRWFEGFVETLCQVLPVTEAITRRSGELRGRFRSCGKTQSVADTLITATAQRHGLTLATRNVRHFEGCGVPLFNPFR